MSSFQKDRAITHAMPRPNPRKPAGESGNFGQLGRQQIVASWLESLGALGGLSFGFRSWTGDEPILRHPSRVPILDGLAAHGAFKAADLARLYDVLAAVINRAAFTGSMMTQLGFGHALRCASACLLSSEQSCHNQADHHAGPFGRGER